MPKSRIYKGSSTNQRDSQHRGLIKSSAAMLLFFLSVPCFLIGQEGNDRDVFEKMSVGAFDPDAWNGIVFDGTARGQRLPFAIRLGSKSGRFLDGERIFDAVSTVGPHAPDGSYALLSWRHYPRMAQVTLEWSRIDKTTVVGRLKAPADIHLVLEAYSPFESDFTGAYYISRDGKQIIGDHFIEGHFTSAAHIVATTDRPILGTATFPKVAELREVMDAGNLMNAGAQKKGGIGPDVVPGDGYADDRDMRGAAGLEFITNTNSTAHFVATVGWNVSELTSQTKELLEPGRIDRILDQKALQYEQRRPHAKGLFSEAPAPIGNSMFWNTLYVPSLDLEFPSISRAWVRRFGGWVVGEWDCFFGALLTNVEDTAQTSASTRAILLSQAPNGVVPNFASGGGTSPDRSQPPVGSYVVWKNYQGNGDKEVLQWAYPRLKRWHEWWFSDRGDGQPWRDGNRNGLLEWGSDKGSALSGGGRGYLQGAKWESGMDDSPMYDDVLYDSHTYTMNLDDVGLNSLYALDSECLEKIAEILGKEDDKRRFTSDYERVKRTMQQLLWNEKDGIYENRYWDGHFSRRLSPTNFYPMLAGVATPEQAKRMVKEHLLNREQFWGQYVIPTISRDDAAFEDQFYWRGDIWGPTNYLVYEGLNRYGEDEAALQFAEKSYDLFMNDWHAHQYTNEQYYAWGGSAGGDKHYTWGALLCLIPLEQYMDETPWGGLRFGALNPHTSGELANYSWNNHRYNISIGPDRTAVERDGVVRFEANAGVVVRNYKLSSNRVSFAIKTRRPIKITTRELTSGTLSLEIDDRPAKSVVVQEGNVVFAISAGEHRVAEVWK